MFGFDFNFPGPIESMERFFRILDCDQNLKVVKLTRNILRQHICIGNFLNYRPSQVAACAVIIAINIREKRSMICLDIWNNEKIQTTTGYSTEML